MTVKLDWDALEGLKPGPVYTTKLGQAWLSTVEDFLESPKGKRMKGKVDLILTSPPFPLLQQKRYKNLVDEEYMEWMESLAKPLGDLLSPTGSLVLEIGNAWTRGEPTMSTTPLETLIRFGKAGDLKICQQLICNNTARLPSPAAWVTINRIRVKDSFTHVWWYSRTDRPKADNRRVLQPYSESMLRLIRTRKYNAGERPSEHKISPESFFKDHGGAIPSSVLNFANTNSPKAYRDWCKEQEVRAHPARMQAGLVDFFINLLTDPGDLVFDPFGGSNTTGYVAETLGRKWVTCEKSHEYVLGSAGRFVNG